MRDCSTKTYIPMIIKKIDGTAKVEDLEHLFPSTLVGSGTTKLKLLSKTLPSIHMSR